MNSNKSFILFIITICFFVSVNSCASAVKTKIVELENKGTGLGVGTPDWVRLYVEKGISALQALPQYKDKYCIVGEESGQNRQFVVAWADMASAQQRLGALVRINIASRYEAGIKATSQSGGANLPFALSSEGGSGNSSSYQQEINSVLNAVVNVSYSGAQREADWWSLRRSYDPQDKEKFSDMYTAFVFYTVPKAELNRQIASAMETSISKDSALYDITIALARDLLLQGYDERELQSTAIIQKTASDSYDPPGSLVANALDTISYIDEYVLGRDVAALILSNYKLSNMNSGLTAYVNRILSALVINSPRPSSYNGYYAAVLDSEEINAFATPGGHIFITQGLISTVKSEDALAAIIAHELAHIQLRHGMRAIRTNRNIEDWVNQFFSSGSKVIADKMNAGFSQTQEFDADITALSLLVAAGYNTQGLIDALTELEKNQSGVRGGFNSTHPSPSSRLVNAKIAAARYAKLHDNSKSRQNRFAAAKR